LKIDYSSKHIQEITEINFAVSGTDYNFNHVAFNENGDIILVTSGYRTTKFLLVAKFNYNSGTKVLSYGSR
jgi:hypothetical protein